MPVPGHGKSTEGKVHGRKPNRHFNGQPDHSGASIVTTQLCPISDLATAQALDSEVITLTSQLVGAMRSWSRIGHICVLMDRDEHCRALGYDGVNAWMMSVEARTGYSRSSLYRFKSKWLEIEGHPQIDDLCLMTEGTMEVFRQLSDSLQSDPQIMEIAKNASRSKVLREHIAKTHPEEHVELKIKVELSFDASFAEVFHALVEQTRLAEDDPGLSYEKCIEAWGASWVQEHQN